MEKVLRNIKLPINNVARAEAPLGPLMCRRSFQVNSFVEKAYVTLVTGVCGTHAWWGEKRQRDTRDRVEKSVQC